ncbi:hypothetical protein ES705_50651 [subsurface metagenome]
MSKRIFTKVWAGYVNVEPGGYPAGPMIENAINSWLLQENVEVIGASMALVNTMPSENDGFSQVLLELSQSGIYGTDGGILAVMSSEGWNTTPAGIFGSVGHSGVMFPDGKTIPVREEGHLYLNVSFTGKSAGICVYSFEVMIYYTKQGSR